MKFRAAIVLLLVLVLGALAGSVFAQDADSDGVLDGADICGNTPSGTTVDAEGCPVPATFGDMMSSAGNTFTGLGIEALIAIGAVIAGVGYLSFRVLRAVR